MTWTEIVATQEAAIARLGAEVRELRRVLGIANQIIHCKDGPTAEEIELIDRTLGIGE